MADHITPDGDARGEAGRLRLQLDEETLALARRAQPFPPPPADISDDQLSFVVPIRYAATARR